MSQFNGETREIDGNKYTVYMLGPMVSHDLLVDLSKMVGPSLGPVLDVFANSLSSGKPTLENELNADFFTKAASSLFASLDKVTLKNIINSMAEVTHVDGKPLKPIFEAHFRGKLQAMYKWLAFAMQAQWGKCLSALVDNVQARGADMANIVSLSRST